jgi:hypothetical protein
MCIDPVTLGAIGTLVSVAGSIASGAQAQAQANAQAKALEQQAQADNQAAGYEAQRERRQQELRMANARAQVGASGVALAGSPTEVLVANAREGEMDIQAIRYGSQLRQNNLYTQAGIAKMQGKQAMTAGLINAGSGLVSGLSSLYDPQKSIKFGKSPFSYGGGLY